MMKVKMRCNRKVIREESGKIVTERSFISTDRKGQQMNGEVVNANYLDTVIGEVEDTSVSMQSIVTFNFDVSTAVEDKSLAQPPAQ